MSCILYRKEQDTMKEDNKGHKIGDKGSIEASLRKGIDADTWRMRSHLWKAKAKNYSDLAIAMPWGKKDTGRSEVRWHQCGGEL